MKTALLCTVLFALLRPINAAAQQPAAPAARRKAAATERAKVAPLYAIGGVMRGSTITAESGGKNFTYQLTSASIADGKLQFTGIIDAQPAKKVTATLAATTARSANPWPSAASSGTATVRRPAQRSNTKPEEQRSQGEVNEQTQSLYSAASAGSGCELLYLKMRTPLQAQPVQVGVVLAHQDNTLGNEINQAVCRVVWALHTKQSAEAALAQLNELLARARGAAQESSHQNRLSKE